MVSSGWKFAPANPQIFSDRRTILNFRSLRKVTPRKSDLNLGTLLREETSELGTFLRKQFQWSLIYIGLSVCSSL